MILASLAGRRTTSEHVDNPVSDLKLEAATKGLQPYLLDHLKNLVVRENALTIANYVIAYDIEKGLSAHHKTNTVLLLKKLSEFHNKTFNALNRQDIATFLKSFKKTEEADPMHGWIGTYNNYLTMLKRFFRWLYFPEMDSELRKKKTPDVIENIGYIKRKEKAVYTPSDLWTEEDDAIFLKYANNNRDRCYHAVAKDTGCRPHELLKLRIEDIIFPEEGTHAEITVNGKTGNRTISLIDSVGEVKRWLEQHPLKHNPKAVLFCGAGDFGSSKNHFKPMKSSSIYLQYRRYKTEFLPRKLQAGEVSELDKKKLQALLRKPFNPYVLRHSALTEFSKEMNENALKQQAGWSITSKNPQRYIHYYGNEAVNARLKARGLKNEEDKDKAQKIKKCPNCNEINPLDSKFCLNEKCHMILSKSAYLQTRQNAKSLEERMHKMEDFLDQNIKGNHEFTKHLLKELKDSHWTISALAHRLAKLDPKFSRQLQEIDAKYEAFRMQHQPFLDELEAATGPLDR